MSEKIQTVEEFIKWVSNLSGRFMLYRGLPREDWKVESSASRRIGKDSNSSTFKNYILNLLEDARQNGLGHHADAELCDLELLANLQHHGAATCLIDFTQLPLTALWFACNDEPDRNGRVISMKTENTDLFQIVDSKRQKKRINSFFKKENLWKWEPRYINNRIIAQKSTFVFGNTGVEESHYNSVIIECKSKAKLIEELEGKHNISEEYLFKDMSGFSRVNAHDKIYTGYSKDDYFKFGENARQKQEYKRAVEYYSKAIELNPNYAEAFNNRGIAKAHISDHKGARQDFKKSAKLNNNSPDNASKT